MKGMTNSNGKKTAKAIFLILCFFLAISILLFGLGDRLPEVQTAYAEYGDTNSALDLSVDYAYDSSKTYYTIEIPYSGVYKLECWGASGGSIGEGTGGKGGYVWANGYFVSGTVLYIYIGQAGGSSSATAGGGGAADNSTSGGGSTDIRYNGTDLSSRIMVAGGGGGGSRSQTTSVGSSSYTPTTVYAAGGNGGGDSSQDWTTTISSANYGYGFDGSAGGAKESHPSGFYSYSGSLGATGGAGGTRTGGNALQTGQSTTGGSAGGGKLYLYKGNYLGAGGGGYYGGYAGTASTSAGYNRDGTTNYTYTPGSDSPTYYMTSVCACGGGGGSSYISGYKRSSTYVCSVNAGYEFLLSDETTEGKTVGGAFGGGTGYGNSGNGRARITFVDRYYETHATNTVQRIPITQEGWYKVEALSLSVGTTYGDKVTGYIYLDAGTFLLMKIASSTGYNNGDVTIKAMAFNAQYRTQAQVDSDYDSATTVLCAGAGGRSSATFLSGHNGYAAHGPYLFYRSSVDVNGSITGVPKVTITFVNQATELVTLISNRKEASSTTSWTIPENGKYFVKAWGANESGVNGSMAASYIWMLEGEVLNVVVTDGQTKVYIGAVADDNVLMTANAGTKSASVPSSRRVDAHAYSRVNDGGAYFMAYLVKLDTDMPSSLTIQMDRDGKEESNSTTDVRGWYYNEVTAYFYAKDIDGADGSDDSGVVQYMYRVVSGGDTEPGAFVASDTGMFEDNTIFKGYIDLSWPASEGTQTFTIEMYAIDFVGNISAAISYTIGFNRNVKQLEYYDGSGSVCKTVDFHIETPVIYTENEESGFGLAPSRTGMDFLGWYQLKNETELSETPIIAVNPASYMTSASGVAVYALYELHDVTITGEATTVNVTYNVGNGVSLTAPAYEHEASVAFNYVWEVKQQGNIDFLPAGKTTENFMMSWTEPRTFTWTSGTYSFRQRIGASLVVTYKTGVMKTYETPSVQVSPIITVAVAKKSLTHEDVQVLYGNLSHTYTGLAIEQTALRILDKEAEISTIHYEVSYPNDATSSNVNASTDTVKGRLVVTAAEDDPYYTGEIAGTDAVTFIIDRKPLSEVSISSYGPVVYNGDIHTPGRNDVTVSWMRGAVEVVLAENSDFRFSYGNEEYNNVDAGFGVVNVEGLGNYTGKNFLLFAIEKATSIVDVSNVLTTYTYTGETQAVSDGAFAYIVVDGETRLTGQTIRYGTEEGDNEFVTVLQGDGKEVTIYALENANYKDSSATVTLTVYRKEPTIDLTNVPKQYRYDGSEKNVTRRAEANNVGPNGRTESTLSYDLELDGVLSGDTRFTDVPTTYEEVEGEKRYYYVLHVSLAQSVNYLEKEETCKIYVQKAEYVVELATDVDEYAVTYDGEEHVIVGFASVPGNDQAGAITYSDNVILNVPASGTQRVYAHVAETRNYSQTQEAYIDVPVYPVTPVIDDTAIVKRYRYNQGNDIVVASGATAYFNRTTAEGTEKVYVTEYVVITYEDNVFNAVADTGYMTVRVRSDEENGDHNYREVTKQVFITVFKDIPTVDELELTAVYGELLASARPTHPSVVTKREDGYKIENGLYVPDDDGDTGLGTVNVPNAHLTATFIPDDEDNYERVYDVRIIVTLTKATRELNVDGVLREYTFSGMRQYFTGAFIGDDEGEIVYSPTSFYYVSDMNGRDLTVSVAATDNYESAEERFTITVLKALEIVDVSGIETFVYTGETYSVEEGAALYNVEQIGTLSYSENEFTTVAEAENTVVTISAAETDNYLATSTTFTPVMNRASVYFDHSAIEKNYTYQFTYDSETRVSTGVRQTVTGTVVCYNAEVRSGDEYVKTVEEEEGMTVVFGNNTFTTVPEGNALVVRLSVAQTANYAASETVFRITVEKATPVTYAQTATVTYGSPLMSATGLEANYTFIDGSVSVGSVQHPATGLCVRYTPPREYADNFLVVDTVPLTLTVEKGTSGLSTTRVRTEYTYTGSLQTVNSGATITNDEQEIVYSNNTFTTVAEGDGLEVVVTVPESDNYVGAQTRVRIVVNKADPELDVSDIPTRYVYNGTRQYVTGARINNEEQTLVYTTNSFISVAEGNAIRSVRISVASSPNYKTASATVYFEVAKATQIIDTSVAEAGFVYTGEEQTVTASIADPEQTLVYTNNKFTTVAEGNGMRISITAAETPNYNAVGTVITIEVRKRVPATEAQTVSAFYGQILNDIKGKLTRGYAFEQLLITSVGTPDDPCEVTLRYDSGDPNEEIVGGVACSVTVLPRPITIVPDDVTTTYGDDGFTTAELTYGVEGNTVLDGDDLNVVLTATDVVGVPGEYAIRATASNDLYDVTCEEGTYRIVKRKVFITPDVAYSYYGEEPSDLAYTVTSGSLYGSDELTGSLSIDVELLAGGYEIVNGVTHEYYEVELTNSLYTVLKRPITVYADTATSVYGEDTVFTYVTEPRDGYGLTGDAMIGTDTLAGRLYLEKKDVGRQVILSELYNANYDVEYVSAYCMVSPASITVAAISQTSVYGDRAVFLYEVTEGTVLEGDDVGAVLTQEEQNVGEYDIEGSFTNENYVVTFVSAKHTITPRPVTVKLTDVSRTRLTYLEDNTMDGKKYIVTAGSVVNEDDLMLVVVKEDGSTIGEYDMTATSRNENYDVTVRKGVFTITKDPATITVDEKSLLAVYDGKEHSVKATVSSGAVPNYFYKGDQKEDVCVAVGSYLIRITAPDTDLFFAPEAVEVTLVVNKAELKDDSTGVTVLSASEGFAPDEKLVVSGGNVEWNAEENGALPDSYGVTESYEIKKVNGKNEESELTGEITVKIALSNRFSAGQTVALALVCDDKTVLTEATVDEDGTVTVTGTNLSRVAVIEQQNKPTLAMFLIIAGAAVMLLFVFIMVKAGLSRK